MSDIKTEDYASTAEAYEAFARSTRAAMDVLKTYIDTKDASTRTEALQAVQNLLSQIDDLDALEQKLAALQALLGGETATVITQLRADLTALTARVTALEGVVTSNAEAAEIKFNALNVWKTATATTLETLNSQIADLAAEVSALKARPTVSHNDVLELGNKINHAIRSMFALPADNTP